MRWHPGDKPTRGRFNHQLFEIAANRVKVDPRSDLEIMATPFGRILRRTKRRPVWGVLSGSGPTYTFAESVCTSSGGWATGPGSGTAYEVNGITGLSGTRQLVRPDRLGTWRFQAMRFGSGSGGSGGSGTVAFCFCTELPTTLHMTSSDSTVDYGTYRNATLQYGSVPSSLAGLGLGTTAYISTVLFTANTGDVIGPGTFYYGLQCIYNQFSLFRYWVTTGDPGAYPAPYQDGPLYTWFVGSSGNTCGVDVCSFTNGLALPDARTGTDPTVTITGP